MKYIVEFGNRGGAHGHQIVPTMKSAIALASQLVGIFKNDNSNPGASPFAWSPNKAQARLRWQSLTHFVAMSRLDGVPRGPASAELWARPDPQGREAPWNIPW